VHTTHFKPPFGAQIQKIRKKRAKHSPRARRPNGLKGIAKMSLVAHALRKRTFVLIINYMI
jgi:hypothetical protein